MPSHNKENESDLAAVKAKARWLGVLTESQEERYGKALMRGEKTAPDICRELKAKCRATSTKTSFVRPHSLMGSLVRIDGLTSVTGRQLNGEVGTVTSELATGRLCVCLGHGRIHNIMPPHLVDVAAEARAYAQRHAREAIKAQVQLDLGTLPTSHEMAQYSAADLLSLVAQTHAGGVDRVVHIAALDTGVAADTAARILTLAAANGPGTEALHPLVTPSPGAHQMLIAFVDALWMDSIDKDARYGVPASSQILMALSQLSSGFPSPTPVPFGGEASITSIAGLQGLSKQEALRKLQEATMMSEERARPAAAWASSFEGLAAKRMLAESGLFAWLVHSLDAPLDGTPLDYMHRIACCQTLKSTCLGRESAWSMSGAPEEATARRELASAAGAIEALVGLISHLGAPERTFTSFEAEVEDLIDRSISVGSLAPRSAEEVRKEMRQEARQHGKGHALKVFRWQVGQSERDLHNGLLRKNFAGRLVEVPGSDQWVNAPDLEQPGGTAGTAAELLKGALDALGCICLGSDTQGDDRRARAVAIHAPTVLVRALVNNYTGSDLVATARSCSDILANGDPEIKKQWEVAMDKYGGDEVMKDRIKRDAMQASIAWPDATDLPIRGVVDEREVGKGMTSMHTF